MGASAAVCRKHNHVIRDYESVRCLDFISIRAGICFIYSYIHIPEGFPSLWVGSLHHVERFNGRGVPDTGN